MRTISCCGDERFSFNTVITLGSFDGIHIGHQALFETALKIAQKEKLKAAVYTFKEHPLKKISPQSAKKILMNIDEKETMVAKWGFDYLILSEFSKKIQHMEPETFVKQVLVDAFNMKVAVIGENYRFGTNGSGSVSTLQALEKKYKFSVEVVDSVMLEGQMVSSTRIRNLIDEGKVKKASCLLGRNYTLTGVVRRGYQRGRQMGIPTANLQVDEDRIVPKKGVYITQTTLADGRTLQSVTSISENPTFGQNPLTVETHINSFNEDIYGQQITVTFIDWIRDEKKFSSIEQLTCRIKEDIEISSNYKPQI